MRIFGEPKRRQRGGIDLTRYLCTFGHRHRNPQPADGCVPYDQHGPLPPIERFWMKVSKTETCWLWLGAKRGKGYGAFALNNRMVAAHVWLWEQENGPVPNGMELDHLCRVHACVRPIHLEPVTPLENMRRGNTNMTKTHCKWGHPFDAENTYHIPSGGRDCRQCRRRRHLMHAQKKRCYRAE